MKTIKEMEQKLVVGLRTKTPKGYNIADGGEGDAGWHHSAETKQQMSEARKGSKAPRFGKHPSVETRKKMSEAHKGSKNSSFGKHPSAKTRKKISEANKGRRLLVEARKKMSEACKGSKNQRAIKIFANHIEYGCIKDAAEAMGIKAVTLQWRFRKWNRAENFPAGFGYVTN